MWTIYKKLNVSPNSFPLVIPIKQYSSDFILKIKLYSTDGDLDIEAGATTKIRGTKRDGNGFELTGTRIGNTCTFSGTKAQMQQMTAAHGRCVFEIVVEKNTRELITANFYLEVQRAAMDAGTVTSESIIEEFADFQSKITAARAAADRAEAAAESIDFGLDATPTQGSTNAVQSGGVYDAIEASTSTFADSNSDGNIVITLGGTPEVVPNRKSYVTPEMYGAIGDGVADDTQAFNSIPSNSIIIGKSGATYRVNQVGLTNCMVYDCSFYREGYTHGDTEATKRTYMIRSYNSKFFNCSFQSVCDKKSYIQESETGVVSNVVGIVSNDYIYCDGCKFTNCFGVSSNGAEVHILNSEMSVEMGLYADNGSEVHLHNTKINVLASSQVPVYHALYIPDFNTFDASGCTFEMQSGNANCGNAVHFYTPDTETFTENIGYFNDCEFAGQKSLFRLYIKCIFSGCRITTTEQNSTTALIVSVNKIAFASTFKDCIFRLKSCRFNTNTVYVSDSTFFLIDGTLYQGTDTTKNYFVHCIFHLGLYNIMLNGRVDNDSKITYWIDCTFYTNKSTTGIRDYDNNSVFKLHNCIAFAGYDTLYMHNSNSTADITII